MALPIAPTPVLTGKSAIALERYMRESKYKKERIVSRPIDPVALAEAHRKMMEKRARLRAELLEGKKSI